MNKIATTHGPMVARACPHCGALLDMHTNVTGVAAPEPGDVGICFACLGPYEFGDTLRAIALTDIPEDDLRAELAAWIDALKEDRGVQ